jgi:hypothetical protein
VSDQAAHRRYVELRDVKYMQTFSRYTALPYVVGAMRWLSRSRARVTPLNDTNNGVDTSQRMPAEGIICSRDMMARRMREPSSSSAGLKRQWSFAVDDCSHRPMEDDDDHLGQALTLTAWSDLEKLYCNRNGDVAGQTARLPEAFFAEQVDSLIHIHAWQLCLCTILMRLSV